MGPLGIAFDMVRLILALAALAEADNNSQRLARCRARRRTKGFAGAIAHGLCVLCNLEDLLWRRALGWEAQPSQAAVVPCRPCGQTEVD